MSTLMEDELGPIPVTEENKRVVKPKWRNRERVLVFCSRGSSYRDRHLMTDLKSLMPHSRGESKFDKRTKTPAINEICEMENCSKCLYFENRKRQDLYLWMANINGGPSAKFLVHNIHTMGELKLTGNCLKGSRPVLSFDRAFDDVDHSPHLALLKELLTQIFATPAYHPKSQPFVDHVIAFSLEDGRIWFRNYQILDEQSWKLEEIGPRLVLEPIKVFEGSFGGPVLYDNGDYRSPNLLRRQLRLASSGKYVNRVQAKANLSVHRDREKVTFSTDPTDDVFETDPGRRGVREEPPAGGPSEREVIRKLKRKLEAKPTPEAKRKRRMKKKENKKKASKTTANG